MDKLDDQDKLEGKVDKAKGKGKDALGDATGDDQTQAEGKADKTKGSGKEKLSDAKDKAKNLIDDATG